MILLLTDETWGRLENVLRSSPGGAGVLRDLTTPPELPEAAELHRMARNDEVPAAVARAAELRRAGIEGAAATRAQMDELLRRCYELGVRPVVLSKWFEISPRLMHKALERTAA
jgi:hypothetical protein